MLVAQPYDTIEDVAARANAGDYGLAAGVWTRNMLSNAHKVAALLRAGSVYVNAWGLLSPSMPFGGFKQSGVGREHGPTSGSTPTCHRRPCFGGCARDGRGREPGREGAR